jgi:type II secretory pathway pseudopilin PulG
MTSAPGPERVPSAEPAGPPPKKSGMTCLIIGLCVGAGGFVVLAILAALLLPAIAKATERAKVVACANNLRQLWMMQQTYATQFGGREKDFPTETGSAFWLKLTRTTPPLLDESEADVLLCPCREPGRKCDYAGPSRPVKSLQSGDPVGADLQGNHPSGGNVLRKDGSIHELQDVEFTGVFDRLSP